MVGDELDALYGLPLDAFVKARDALAKRRRQAGDREGASEVKALVKPSLPAWVLNRLVRTDRGLVDAYLDALDAQRAAQIELLTDPGAQGGLREAGAHVRARLGPIEARARVVLGDDGHGVSDAHVERVTRCLRAAALDPEARGQLLQGRLTTEAAGDGGFGALAPTDDATSALLAALGASARTDGPPAPRPPPRAAPPRSEAPLRAVPDPRAAEAALRAAEARARLEAQARLEAELRDLERRAELLETRRLKAAEATAAAREALAQAERQEAAAAEHAASTLAALADARRQRAALDQET